MILKCSSVRIDDKPPVLPPLHHIRVFTELSFNWFALNRQLLRFELLLRKYKTKRAKM